MLPVAAREHLGPGGSAHSSPLNEQTADKLRWLSGALKRISEVTGTVIAWLTLPMVLGTFIIVVLRYRNPTPADWQTGRHSGSIFAKTTSDPPFDGPALIANDDPEGGQFIHVRVAPDGSRFRVRIGADGPERSFDAR